jgi:hypothetical protein
MEPLISKADLERGGRADMMGVAVKRLLKAFMGRLAFSKT